MEAISPKVMEQGRRRSSQTGGGFAGDEDLDQDAWVGEKNFEFATTGVKQSTCSSYIEVKEARQHGKGKPSPSAASPGGDSRSSTLQTVVATTATALNTKDKQQVQRALDGLR